MSDVLRAAAERIKASAEAWLRENPPPGDEWDEDAVDPDLVDHWQDQVRVATACLAEHPADDAEPADSTWAEAVGFEFSDRDVMYKYVLPGCNLKVVLTGDLAEGEKDTHLSLHWSNYPYEPRFSGSLSVDDNPTRGDVRRLFAALGEPLKEPTR